MRSFAGRLPPSDVSDLFLSNLPTASPVGIGPLAHGLCQLQVLEATKIDPAVASTYLAYNSGVFVRA